MIQFIKRLFKTESKLNTCNVDTSILECDCKEVKKHNAEILTEKGSENYRVRFCKDHLTKELEKGFMAEYLG